MGFAAPCYQVPMVACYVTSVRVAQGRPDGSGFHAWAARNRGLSAVRLGRRGVWGLAG